MKVRSRSGLRRRERLAAGLEHALDRAERPASPWCAEVPVCRSAVREARGPLLDLAERLRMPRPVNEAGVRMARDILTDGCGPLYVPSAPGALRDATRRALHTLDAPLLR